MARLESLTRGASVAGLLPHSLVTVVDVRWHGDTAITLTYTDERGQPGHELRYYERLLNLLDIGEVRVVVEGYDL